MQHDQFHQEPDTTKPTNGKKKPAKKLATKKPTISPSDLKARERRLPAGAIDHTIWIKSGKWLFCAIENQPPSLPMHLTALQVHDFAMCGLHPKLAGLAGMRFSAGLPMHYQLIFKNKARRREGRAVVWLILLLLDQKNHKGQ